MIKRILTNQDLSIKRRLKNTLLYLSRVRGAKRSWEKRHKKVLEINESYSKPCDKSTEFEHRGKWSAFRSQVDTTTLRISKNLSGRSDPRIIPEDIYVSDIEPTLEIDDSVNYLSNKSFYNRWFNEGNFPEEFLHCLEGQYYNYKLERINFEEFKNLAKNITYPVVLKPNRGTYGGEGVKFVESYNELINISEKGNNFVVQEKIEQHYYFKKFNPLGLNTIRVYLYRSVLDNELHILNMALRMGKDGSLDNVSVGGIHTLINFDGSLNGYAVDKYGTKYYEHPNSGYNFDSKIPDHEGLKELSLKVGNNVFLSRIIGLDACLDKNGQWRIIEVNTKSHSLRFAQYGGQPFFREFTDEIIEYCTKNHWALTD